MVSYLVTVFIKTLGNKPVSTFLLILYCTWASLPRWPFCPSWQSLQQLVGVRHRHFFFAHLKGITRIHIPQQFRVRASQLNLFKGTMVFGNGLTLTHFMVQRSIV
jgi:hypothetical protein